MKKTLIILVMLGSITSTQVWASAIQLQNLQGKVQIQRSGQVSWVAADEGVALAGGDRVKVGKKSSADLLMQNGTVIALDENTEFGIERYDIQEDVMEGNFNLTLGKLKAKVGKLKKGSEFQIRTPTAVAAVRGTLFDLWVLEMLGEYLSKLKVWEGVVAFCDEAGANCEDIQEGEGSEKGSGDQAEDERTFDDSGIEGYDEESEGGQEEFEEEENEEQHHDDFLNY